MRQSVLARAAALVAVASVAALVTPAGPASAAPAAAPGALPAAALPRAEVPEPGSYRALEPRRVVDTRTTGTRLARDGRLAVVLLGRYGIPTSGVGAVQLHVTAVGASRSGYLTVHSTDLPRPRSSSLNYAPGRPVANTVTAMPGADGALLVDAVGAEVHVVVDLVGWFAAPASATSAGFHAIAPQRAYDSRTAGRPIDRVGATVPVVGGAVPGDAGAVVVNLTTVAPSATGVPLVAWASGRSRPSTSVGNAWTGSPVATQAIVPVGTDGRVALATGSGRTHVVVDVLGYVVTPRPTGGQLGFVPSVRLVDTRRTGVPVRSGDDLVQQVAGRPGVPADATAALVTITSVPGYGGGGTLAARAHGWPLGETSDLNARTDVPVARQVLVRLGVDGAFVLHRAGGAGHVVIDLVGYATAVPEPVVVPPSAEVLAQAMPDDGRSRLARQVLGTSVRYAIQTWWPNVAPMLLAQPMDTTAQLDRTDAVRRLSMEALAISTALATGTYDETSTGMLRANAAGLVGMILARVTCRHRANVVDGWGWDWQSTLWSSLAARAAWLSWSGLPESTRSCVRRMVVSEADFSTTLRPRYLVEQPSGVVRDGDSGAEENSWFALAPAVAVAMMPSAERRDLWRAGQVRMLASSWNRELDAIQNPTVDGVPLRNLVEGFNVMPDGTVLNHRRIAPDYSTNAYQNVDAMLVATLAGHRAPQAAMVGLPAVYQALGTVSYSTADGYLPPGGTVYPQGSEAIYYPQGCDWGLWQELPFALFDTQADLLGIGGPAGSPTDAYAASVVHLQTAAWMQSRSPEGRMYAADDEYNYVGREEHTAQLASQLVLSLIVASSPAGLRTGGAAVRVVPQSDLREAPKAVDETRVMRRR
ncbi:MAG: hypothetical protein U0S36_14215 [Candidatus Nanopelagicales bacterium]